MITINSKDRIKHFDLAFLNRDIVVMNDIEYQVNGKGTSDIGYEYILTAPEFVTETKPQWGGSGLPPVGIEVMCANPENGEHTLLGEVVYSNNQEVVVNTGMLDVYTLGDVSPVTLPNREDELIAQAVKGLLEYGEESHAADLNLIGKAIKNNYRHVPDPIIKHLEFIYLRMAGIHHEPKSVDYMIKLKEIIEELR